jgi:hypothetical protein
MARGHHHLKTIRTSATREAVIRGEVKVKSDFPQALIDKVTHFNANPRSRSAAAQIINDGGRSMIRIAQEIAHQEFKPRTGTRRPRPGSLHYVSSFYFEPATQDSIGRFKARWGNDHPHASYLEYGAPRHFIPKNAGTGKGKVNGVPGYVIFPYDKNATRSQPGRGRGPGTVGTWPAEYTMENWTFSRQVDHPGHKAYRIMERAKKAYQAQARR